MILTAFAASQLRQHLFESRPCGAALMERIRLTGGISRWTAAIVIAGLHAVSPLPADQITLKSGGVVRGELLSETPSAKSEKDLAIRTLSGATVIVPRTDVVQFVRRRLVLEEYEIQAQAAPDTSAAQWELAEWCRLKSLRKERESHLLRVVELDPGHVAAHRALGHIRIDGSWTTQDAALAARGLVKLRGKSAPVAALEEQREDERATEAERAWSKKIKLWHGWLTGSRFGRADQAIAELKAIRDPDAVPALARAARDDSDPDRRLLFVGILARIEGDQPVPALASRSAWDESEGVREAALAGIRGKTVSRALPVFVRALKARPNAVVNRAGAALGRLELTAAIPQLIEALVTRHEYTVEVPNPEPFICTEGQYNTGIQVLPTSVLMRWWESGMLPLIAAAQPPPGTVEGPPKEMMTVTYQQDEENASVLAALEHLTGQNLGFDELAWKKWNAARGHSAAKATRGKP